MRLSFVLAAAAVLLATPALASSSETAAQTPRNEVICKTMGSEPGTLATRRRVCMTRGEWQEMAQNDRHQVELFQIRQLQMPIKR